MRKRTPRQHLDPMAAIARRMPLADDQKTDLGIAYRMQLQMMLRGAGTEESWATLACSMNIALMLCEQHICGGAIETIKLAQDALLSSKARSFRTQKWAFSGDEARIVMRACSIHDEQLEFATKSQVTKALQEVHQRIGAGEVV